MAVQAQSDVEIEIIVNGESRVTAASSLEGLLEELELVGQRVATAINGEFVPSSSRPGRRLEVGDRIEIVSARQGG